MGYRLLRGFNHFVENVLRRRPVGVAHAEVDDVFAAPPRRHFYLPGDVEDIRGQTLDSCELFHLNILADLPVPIRLKLPRFTHDWVDRPMDIHPIRYDIGYYVYAICSGYLRHRIRSAE